MKFLLVFEAKSFMVEENFMINGLLEVDHKAIILFLVKVGNISKIQFS